MTEGNFTDYIKLHITSGNGGKGSTHMRREKFIPKGGPDGGDGGRGGHIILRGNKQLWTLYHLKFKRHFKGDHGGDGGRSTSTGANGKDAYIEVPMGSIIKDADTDQIIGEISENQQELIIAEGGLGGHGNSHFKTAVNQTPKYAQQGLRGIERNVVIELKVLADVGLVGFPNAGKSTLLSVITSARPKIADYEFTTLKPNLGIVAYRDYRSFVIADIPGIIEGASQGRGLGYRFLRHIERNAALLFLVPADSDNIIKEYKILLKELELYNSELLIKNRMLAITKSDLLDDELQTELTQELTEIDIPYLFMSSVAQLGLTKLKDELWQLLSKED